MQLATRDSLTSAAATSNQDLHRAHHELVKPQPCSCRAPLEHFDVNYAALLSRLAPDGVSQFLFDTSYRSPSMHTAVHFFAVIIAFITAILTATNVVVMASHQQPLTDIFEAAQVILLRAGKSFLFTLNLGCFSHRH